MPRVTVFGGYGVVGSAVVKELTMRQIDVVRQPRDSIVPPSGGFGTLIWCIGLTADFRSRPIATATAHVGLLAEALGQDAHERVVYLSSARVYGGASSTSEDAALMVRPLERSDLYNATKLAGEALVLTSQSNDGIVVRLSNVVGPSEVNQSTFVGMIARQALEGAIRLETTPSSEKDYVWIGDAARWLADISIEGSGRLYNLGRGIQTQNWDWAEAFARATGCRISARPSAPTHSFPPLDISRIQREFPLVTQNPLDKVAEILKTTST